ncbi:YggU family protein [Methanocella sp. CWC-04]|uniref:UPF0235 protein CUJ83_05670 n=1 Tax=Methanooceanicella nereidis TaxID=2052831 RepID=A0AAP2RCC1_9EURY|nr:DUF167 domain-containing protein [Methanocella sp. CWC-04]MCD1294487.1 YggU family protein [Methanocella sp. CWC-04]
MSFEDAIKPVKDGVVIDFEVTPGAKNPAMPSGYNVWRKRIEVKLRSPPEKGKANEELISALSGLLNVKAAYIEIMSGSTNQWKSIKVTGVNADDVAKCFRGKL